MDKTQLGNVRQRAVDALSSIIGKLDDNDPQQEFNLCMSIVHSSDNSGMLERALEAALRIEDSDIQADYLMQVLSEANYLEHKLSRQDD